MDQILNRSRSSLRSRNSRATCCWFGIQCLKTHPCSEVDALFPERHEDAAVLWATR
jgi:hypothetical protein